MSIAEVSFRMMWVFECRYTFLAEHHPQEKKAGVTIKKPMQLQ